MHTFFANKSSISCDNGENPILGLKIIEDSGGYTTEFVCPADDSMRFVKTENYSYPSPKVSTFNKDNGALTNNKEFVNNWLNENPHIFKCPNNWYLSKIQGSQQGLHDTHNVYNWTCGTIYNDYTNNDGVYFQWRYYIQDDKLFLRILTNIKLMVDLNDTEVQTYIEDNGQYIDFDFNYNVTENTLSVKIKNSNFENYYDVTNECYIANTMLTVDLYVLGITVGMIQKLQAGQLLIQ